MKKDQLFRYCTGGFSLVACKGKDSGENEDMNTNDTTSTMVEPGASDNIGGATTTDEVFNQSSDDELFGASRMILEVGCNEVNQCIMKKLLLLQELFFECTF
ncbi:MAG: hypothetical protein R2794_09685 [Chitinophagales bacterium]